MVEEGIIIDGYLKGAGMDPFDSFFTMLGNNPIVQGKPDDWIFFFLPWLLLMVFVSLVFTFGRLLGLTAIAVAFVSGFYFTTETFPSELVLVGTMVLGLFAAWRHLESSGHMWWL